MKKQVDLFLKELQQGQCDYRDAEQLDDIANYLIEHQRFVEANAAIRVCKDMHPNYSDIQLVEARLALVTHNPERALDILEALKGKTEFQDEFTFLMLTTHLDLGHDAVAKRWAEEFMDRSIHKEDFLALCDDIITLFNSRGQFQAAHKLIRKALDIRPNDLRLRELLAINACDDDTELDAAIDKYNEYVKERPFDSIMWQHLTNLYARRKKWEEASWAIEYAYAANPKAIGLLHQKAQMYYANEDWEGCIITAKRYLKRREQVGIEATSIIEQVTGTTFIRAMMADSLYHLGKLDDAYNLYMQLRQEGNREVQIEIEAARVCSQLGRWKEAYDILDQAHKMTVTQEERIDWMRLHMMVCMHLERVEEARQDATIILEQDKKDLDAIVVMASLHINMDQFQQAMTFVQTGLDANPEHPLLLFYKAVIHHRLNENDAVQSILPRLKELDRSRYDYFINHFT